MINQMPLMAILLAIALVGGGCASKHESDKNQNSPAVSVKGVGLETIRTVAVPEMLDVVGTVRARTSAVVSARVPGVISVLKVREGDRVRKGQVLAQLDAMENQATAAVAIAGIDEARRALEEAQSRKKLADTTFDRFSKLFSEQAISRQEFDVKQTERELATHGVSRAEARLKQAQEGSRAAGTMADYTRIIAPISGIITSKQADLGATVFPAQPLMTIEDEGSYQLELAIPESMAAKVGPGTVTQVSLDATDSTFTSKISEIVPSADPVSRTFIAKINLGGRMLKSGMFGRGAIMLGSSVNGLVVAKNAVIERGNLTSVWVVDSQNIARMRLVKVGKTIGDRVEILSGLSAGERVVVSGAGKVSEGVKVE